MGCGIIVFPYIHAVYPFMFFSFNAVTVYPCYILIHSSRHISLSAVLGFDESVCHAKIRVFMTFCPRANNKKSNHFSAICVKNIHPPCIFRIDVIIGEPFYIFFIIKKCYGRSRLYFRKISLKQINLFPVYAHIFTALRGLLSRRNRRLLF